MVSLGALALLCAACGPPLTLFYETTGILHAPVNEAKRDALVAAVITGLDGRRAVVEAPGEAPVVVTQQTAPTLDVAVLQALFMVLPGEIGGRGAELDLLVRREGAAGLPVTVRVDLERNLTLVPGPVPPERGPAPGAAEIRARFGIGPLQDTDAGWGTSSRRSLALALERLSPEERAVLAGMPFVRAVGPRSVASPDQLNRGAQYMQENCRASIVAFDLISSGEDVQFVGRPDDPLPSPMFAFLHEIGHALHHRAGRVAFCEHEAVLEARNARARALGDRIDAFNALVRRANAGDAAAREALQRLRPTLEAAQVEVARMDQEIDRTFQAAERLARRGPVLDAYARAVGDGAPTRYGRQSLAESFAESFALFKADPEALQRALPAAHRFFQRAGHLTGLAEGVARFGR